MSELSCIGNETCTERVTWCRKTQFAGDHPYCDAHAHAEPDFGTVDATGGQFMWFWRDPISQTWTPVRSEQSRVLLNTVEMQTDRIPLNTFEMQVDKPFSVREFMDRARAAGHDAFGIANDPEAIALIEAGKGVTSLAAAAKARELINMPAEPVNHHTRAPNQPTEATIVEGEIIVDHLDDTRNTTYQVKLTRKGPGQIEFALWIDDRICGLLPFDNLIKAATRVDPDHAVGAEKQIRQLRQEAAEAKAQMYDWQAKAMQLETKATQLEEKVARFEETQRAFSEASKA